jgi:hypothetical protein
MMLDLHEGILGEFAEAQGFARSMQGDRMSRFDAFLRLRKSRYNAEEHGRRQCDPKRRAARAESKRNAYAARVGRPVREQSKDPAVQLKKTRARKRRYAAKRRAANRHSPPIAS